MQLKTDTTRLALGVVVLVALALAPLTVSAQTTPRSPTDAQKQEIQQDIDRGDGYQERYEECMSNAVNALLRGDLSIALGWLRAAQAWQGAITANRNLVITKVDIDYDITAPPNTTIEYDPDSTDYGYTTGDKTAQRVVLCPHTFTDGPGLVASTKIHELTHAWQIHSCMSSEPGYWDDCTFWGHYSELEAYLAEEEAYDSGITDDMPEEEKELIKERILEHLLAILRGILSHWLDTLFYVFVGDAVSMPFFVYNPTAEPQLVTVILADQHGWPMSYPMGPILLEPEQSTELMVDILIPDDAPVGAVNQISLVVESDSGASSMEDIAFVRVVPRISVEPVQPVVGARGELVPVELRVVSSLDRDAEIMVDLTSPLGWPIEPPHTVVTLAPGDEHILTAEVLVDPKAEPMAVNLVYCEATPVEQPEQADRAWSKVSVADVDMGPLAITAPIDDVPLGQPIMIESWIKSTGLVSSFVDVVFEIRHEDGTPVSSEAVHVPMVSPGETLQVTSGPTFVEAPGCYDAVVWTQHPEDADPANDTYSIRFDVVEEAPPAVDGQPEEPRPALKG